MELEYKKIGNVTKPFTKFNKHGKQTQKFFKTKQSYMPWYNRRRNAERICLSLG